jgi:molecular chaperone DnaJ
MDREKARKLLGVRETDTVEELKRAYRLKVRQYHPDTSHMVDSGGFALLQEAYHLLLSDFTTEVLQDVKRGEGHGGGTSGDNIPLDDSIYTFLDVTSEDAFQGSSVYISVSDRETQCPRCMGSGVVAESHSRICSACRGNGIRVVMWGEEELEIICGKCKGSGVINPSECSLCRGKGQIRHNREVKVALPRGVRSGTVIKLPGQGPWNSVRKMRGNLYVEINVTLPEKWELKGMDIYAPVVTDIWSILSGQDIAVSTIDGVVMCSFSEAAKHNFREIVLEGRGWVNEDGKRGRHIGIIHIEFPRTPPPESARMLLNLLELLWPAGNRPLALE